MLPTSITGYKGSSQPSLELRFSQPEMMAGSRRHAAIPDSCLLREAALYPPAFEIQTRELSVPVPISIDCMSTKPSAARRRQSVALAAIFLLPLFGSCDSSSSTTPEPVHTVQALSGNTQAGEVGRALGEPLTVEVRRAGANPVEGIEVRWSASAGGGIIQPEYGITDALGRASAIWTLGPEAGEQIATAAIDGAIPATFTAMAWKAAGAVEPISPTELRGRTEEALPEPLQIRVLDRAGEPLPGAEVRWSIRAGNGTLSTSTTITDAEGIAQASWTLGSGVGEHLAEAAVDTLPPVPFTAFAVRPVGPAGAVVHDVTGSVTLAIPAGALRTQQEIGVRARNTGIGEASLATGTIFEMSPAGLRFTVPATLTLAVDPGQLPSGMQPNDLAVHRLGEDGWVEVIGSTVNADGSSVSVPLQGFSAYALLPRRAVAEVRVTPESATTTAIGEQVAFRAHLSDGQGLPLDVGARTITWHSDNPSVAVIDDLGIVTALGNGEARITAVVGDASGSAVFRVTQVPVTLEKAGGDAQTAVVGTPVPVPPAVRVMDAFGNPIPLTPVTFTVSAGGGSVAGASAYTNWEGVAAAESWMLGTTPGANALTATVAGVGDITFTATATGIAPIAEDDAIADDSEPGDPLHGAFNTTLTLAPGELLANDVLGTGGVITHFGAIQMNDGKGSLEAPVGSVTDHAAGVSIALDAGSGALQVNADGSLQLTPPVNYTGLLRFRYRLASEYGYSDATVTLAVGERPVAVDDSYDVLGNVRINVPGAAGLASNDRGDAISYVGSSYHSGPRGKMTITGPSMGLTYNPVPGFEGQNRFTYTIQNGFGQSQATVTFKIDGMIWFVDRNFPSTSGDGRPGNPYRTLADFAAAGLDKPGDAIFLFESWYGYSGGITLKDGQRLIGQDATQDLATLAGVTVPPYSDPLPTMNPGAGEETFLAGAASGITLARDNQIHGLSINLPSGTALSGQGYGKLVVRDVSISSGESAIELDGGHADVKLVSTTALGGVHGVALLDTQGELDLGNGLIQGGSDHGLIISGGKSNLTYAGSIENSSGYALVSELGAGTVTLSGPINAGGGGLSIRRDDRTIEFNGPVTIDVARTGLVMEDMVGGSLRFTGGLEIKAGTKGIDAYGTGMLEVTGPSNSIDAANGPAVHLNGIGLGPKGVTFESISARNGTAGIQLYFVGGGEFTVTGDGGDCAGNAVNCASRIENVDASAVVFGGFTGRISLSGIDFRGGNYGVYAGSAATVVLTNNRFTGYDFDAVSVTHLQSAKPFLTIGGLEAHQGNFFDGNTNAVRVRTRVNATGSEIRALVLGNTIQGGRTGLLIEQEDGAHVIVRAEANDILGTTETAVSVGHFGSGANQKTDLHLIDNDIVSSRFGLEVFTATGGITCANVVGNRFNAKEIHLRTWDDGLIRIPQTSEDALVTSNTGVIGVSLDGALETNAAMCQEPD